MSVFTGSVHEAVGFSLAVFIPVRFDLTFQRHDVIMGRLMGCNTGPDLINNIRLNKKGHTATELTLDGPGCRCDSVLQTIVRKQVMEGQALLVIFKENVIANIRISH